MNRQQPTARAVGFREYGGPEVLEVVEVDVPAASPDDVVVEVAAATVNPVDLKMRNGSQAALMTELRPPYVAGMEFAGHVHAVGSAVQGISEGDAVMGVVGIRRPEGGAHAEYVHAPAASVSTRVGGSSLVDAATLPMNGLAAAMALEAVALPRGRTLLVTGGPGAVGGYAIQLAKVAGLQVVADAHERDVDLLRQLGADRVVPRGTRMTDAVHELYLDGVDGAVDVARLGDATAAAVRDGGMVVTLQRGADGDGRVRRHYISVLHRLTDKAGLDLLGELASDGRITTRVAEVVPFTDAPRAHRLVEKGGLRGRVVLSFE